METIIIDNDIKVFYVTATSFPDGVMDAHKKLRAIVPFSTKRRYFGISQPENETIIYKAAAEEIIPGEAEQYGCDTLILKKGKYISETIFDFMTNIPAIGNAFKQMLTHPDIAPNGYCVELYPNDKDIKCMVRLEE